MRFDPEIADKWKSVEETYATVHEPNVLDSYNSLKYAIRKHPMLSKFKTPYYFDGELQRKLLNPFLFAEYSDENESDRVCDKLVGLIKENVRSEFVKNYYLTLHGSVLRLNRIIRRHKRIMNKIESLENLQTRSDT